MGSRHTGAWVGSGQQSQPRLGDSVLGARPPHPRPADFSVAQFITDLALDTEVHARPLLSNPTAKAQVYRLQARNRSVRVCIAHVPLSHVRAVDETGRFVSTTIRFVLVDGISMPWPMALSAAGYTLTGRPHEVPLAAPVARPAGWLSSL